MKNGSVRLPNNPEPLLHLRRLTDPLPAFAFELYSGEKLGLFGANGSGKTTLLEHIADLHHSANIELVMRPYLKISYQSQHPPRPLGWPLSVRDYLKLAALESLVLPESLRALLDARCDTLSGGQFQQLALSVTLGRAADLILLDEPSHHLDPTAAQWLSTSLHQSRAVSLVISHDHAWLQAHCTRVLELPAA